MEKMRKQYLSLKHIGRRLERLAYEPLSTSDKELLKKYKKMVEELNDKIDGLIK